MSDLTDYLKQRGAERILLLEITRANGDKYYLSDQPYATESVDSPASCQFTPIIARGGIPRIHRALADPLTGRATVTYGTISLSANQGTLVNTSAAQAFSDLDVYKGNAVTVKMAGPRALFAYSTAITLFTGKVQRIGGDHLNGMTIEVTDSIQSMDETLISGATDSDPLAMGQLYNITPYRASQANLIYRVTEDASALGGGANASFSDLLAVYDNAFKLTAGSQYSTDGEHGTFTLVSTPAGIVTCDVQAAFHGTQNKLIPKDMIEWLLDRAGLTSAVLPRNFAGFPATGSGYFLPAGTAEPLAEIITKICVGVGAWWGINRAGEFRATEIPVPASGGPEFDETSLIGAVQFQSEDRVIRMIRSLYRKNWTLISTPAETATTAQALFVKGPGLYATATATGTDESEEDARLEVETFTPFQASYSETMSARVLALYKNRRKIVDFSVPFTDPMLEPGDVCTLTPLGMDCYVMEVDDVFSGEYPHQNVKAIA